MINLALSDEEGSALLDCIAYYRMSDFGCGGSGPTDETQRQHVRDVRSAERKVLVATGGAGMTQIHAAEHGDSVEHRYRPEYGVGKVVGRKFDGRLIVRWPSGEVGATEAPSLRVVTRANT